MQMLLLRAMHRTRWIFSRADATSHASIQPIDSPIIIRHDALLLCIIFDSAGSSISLLFQQIKEC
jgi:hypothetical protein